MIPILKIACFIDIAKDFLATPYSCGYLMQLQKSFCTSKGTWNMVTHSSFLRFFSFLNIYTAKQIGLFCPGLSSFAAKKGKLRRWSIPHIPACAFSLRVGNIRRFLFFFSEAPLAAVGNVLEQFLIFLGQLYFPCRWYICTTLERLFIQLWPLATSVFAST